MNLKTLTVPSYWLPRMAAKRFQKRSPEAPWLVEPAVLILDSWLKPGDCGIEWGSGRSTLWFGARMKKLISVENNEAWYEEVSRGIEESSLAGKVDYRLIPVDYSQEDAPESHPYADVALELADASVDFALVDGKIRIACMEKVMSKIKPGGLLVLDNSERYLPNKAMGGYTTTVGYRDDPASERWKDVESQLSSWRGFATTDRVSETRFWIKG